MDATPPRPASELDRIAAARLMLVKVGLSTDDPQWSSDVLDRLLHSVLDAPDGSASDLFFALFGVLGDYAPELSRPMAAFIKDVLVGCYTRFQRSYELVPWQGMAENLSDKATRAQLYLALHAIPPQFVSPRLANAIVQGLEVTAFRDEAVAVLAA
jgi:hypothetical protein